MRRLAPWSMPVRHRRLAHITLPSLQLLSLPHPARLPTHRHPRTTSITSRHAFHVLQSRQHSSRASTKPASSSARHSPSHSQPSHSSKLNGEEDATTTPAKHSTSPSPPSPSSPSPASSHASSATHPPPSVEQPEMSKFLGASSRFTTDLSLTLPSHYEPMPCFRLTSPAGQLLVPYDIPHSHHQLRRMYSTMIYTSTMDAIFYDAQRQGRISFYMTNYGMHTHHIPPTHQHTRTSSRSRHQLATQCC